MMSLLFLPRCGSRWNREFELDENSFDTEAMEMVKDDSGLNLPATAKGLKFAYKPPIDPAFLAIIQLPEESLDQIKPQIEAILDNPISSTGGLDTRIPWWKPTHGEVIIDRENFRSNGTEIRVI